MCLTAPTEILCDVNLYSGVHQTRIFASFIAIYFSDHTFFYFKFDGFNALNRVQFKLNSLCLMKLASLCFNSEYLFLISTKVAHVPTLKSVKYKHIHATRHTYI